MIERQVVLAKKLEDMSWKFTSQELKVDQLQSALGCLLETMTFSWTFPLPLELIRPLYLSFQPSFCQPIWYRDVDDLRAHPGRAPPNSRHPLAAMPDPHSRLSQSHTSCALAQPNESAGIGYCRDLPKPQAYTRYSKHAWLSLMSPVCTSPDLQVQAR